MTESQVATKVNKELGKTGEWKDLMGPELQMRVTSPGDESRSIEAGDAVFVNFQGRLKDDRDDPMEDDGLIFHEAEQWLITIGDKEVSPALELGLRFMTEGESAIIWSHSKYAYGCYGRISPDGTEMPPNASVIYRVTVTKVVRDDETFSKPDFQLAIARSKKDMGNDTYKNEWQKGQGRNKALLLYKKASDLLNNLLQEVHGELEESVRIECVDLLIDCLNNVSAVHMRAKEYKQAKDAATEVLLLDVDNAKALCRAARASMMDPASSLEEAEGAVEAAEQVLAKEMSPSLQDDILKLRSELTRRKRAYRQHEKAMASKMIQSNKRELLSETKNEETKSCLGASQANRDDTKTDEENEPFFHKYRHLLIQAILPLVTYALFLLAKRFSNVEELVSKEFQAAKGVGVGGTEF